MANEPTPDKAFDTTYVRDLLDEHTANIRNLAATAFELGLESHAAALSKEAWQARVSVGTKYLGSLGEGLIADVALARELALIQHPFEHASQSVATLAIENTIKASLLDKLASDSETEQATLIRDYRAFTRKFITTHSTPNGIEVPSSLEDLTPEQIEQLFDTSPVNKHDLKTSGSSISQAGRIWNALVDYHIDYKERIYVDGSKTSNPAPTIHFDTFDTRSHRDRDTYADLDFKSLYALAQWIENETSANNRKVRDILGSGTGSGTVLGIKQLIAVRKLSDESISSDSIDP